MKKLLPLLFCFIILFSSCSPDAQNQNVSYTVSEVSAAVSDALSFNHTLMNSQSSSVPTSRAIGNETFAYMLQNNYAALINEMKQKEPAKEGEEFVVELKTSEYGTMALKYLNYSASSPSAYTLNIKADSASLSFDDGINRVSLEESNVDISIDLSKFSASSSATVSLTDTRKYSSGALVSFKVSEVSDSRGYTIKLENLTYKGVAITNVSEIQDYIIKAMTNDASNPGVNYAESHALDILNALSSQNIAIINAVTNATAIIDTELIKGERKTFHESIIPIYINVNIERKNVFVAMSGALRMYIDDALYAYIVLDNFAFFFDESELTGGSTSSTIYLTEDGKGYACSQIGPSTVGDMTASTFAESYAKDYVINLEKEDPSSYGIDVKSKEKVVNCNLSGFDVEGYNIGTLIIRDGVTFEFSVKSSNANHPDITIIFTTTSTHDGITSFSIESDATKVTLDSISEKTKTAALNFVKSFPSF